MSHFAEKTLTLKSLSSILSICAIALATHTSDAQAFTLTNRQAFAIYVAIPVALVMTYACSKEQSLVKPTPITEVDLSEVTLSQLADNYAAGQTGSKKVLTMNDDKEIESKEGRPRFGFFPVTLKYLETFFKQLKSIKEMCEVATYFAA